MIEVLRIGNMTGKVQRDYRATCWRCNALFRFDKFDTLYDPLEKGEYAAILLDELFDKQEPVQPIKAKGTGYWCKCGWYLGIRFSGINGSVKYCANCGRKVKWK